MMNGEWCMVVSRVDFAVYPCEGCQTTFGAEVLSPLESRAAAKVMRNLRKDSWALTIILINNIYKGG